MKYCLFVVVLLALFGASATAAPATPSGLNPGSTSSPGPTLSSSTVTLGWIAPSGATSYGLGVRDIASGTLVVNTTVTGTSYTANLTAGKAYRWNLDACSSAGCSSYAADEYFQTPAAITIPATPAGLNPGSTSSPGPTLSSSTVTLGWIAPSGATSYGLGVRDIASGTLVVNTTVTGTSYTANLTAGKAYRWNLDACSSAGCSSYAADEYFQTPAAITIPATPAGLNPGSTSSPGPTLSSSTVTLGWIAPSGATSYGLGVRDIASGTLVVNTTVTGTSYTANLTAGKAYRWNLDACSSAGCSSYAADEYFQTPAAITIPATPAGLNPGSTSSPGPTLSSSTVTLGWIAPSGATSYGLGVRDIASGTLVVNTTVTGTSYTANLTAGKAYRWNLDACSSAGCSSYAADEYFQTPAAITIPATPAGLNPGSTSSPGPTLSSSTVTLGWIAPSGATSYGLGVRDIASGTLVVNTTVTGTSYTANLTAGKAYRWNLDACSSAGCSSYAADEYFQTPAAITIPATPAGLNPGSTSSPGPTLSSSTVTLGWTAPSGATSYGLGVRDIASGTLVVNTTVTGTSYTANLTAGKAYRWNLDACSSAGCSSYAADEYFQTPAAITIPATPAGLNPGSTSSPGPTLSSSTVTLGWIAPSGATSYGLGVRDIASGTLVVNTTVTGTSYTANLTAGKAYRWNLDACSSAGCSSYAADEYFQTPAAITIPATPAGLNPGSTSSPGPTLSSSTVTLGWTAPSGATSYGLGVRDIASGTLVVNTTVTGTSYTANLTAGKAYRWNLDACSSAGCSSYAADEYFQTPAAVGGSYSISASPASQIVTRGGSTSYTVIVQSQNGFSGPVILSILNLPGNQVLPGTQFNPQTVTPSVNGSRNSTLTIVTNASTPTGTFSLTVQGTNGSITRSSNISITVAAQNITSGLSLGVRVKTLAAIDVRTAPPQLTRIGSGAYSYDQYSGVHGTIKNGPVTGTAGGYTGSWWEVDWDAGIDGWSAQNELAVAPAAGDVPQPNFSSRYYTTDNVLWKSGYAPASTNPPTPQLGTALGNCTWYANGRLRELGYNSAQLDLLSGNAGKWADEAAAHHIPVDGTPTPSSIAQTSQSLDGFGHVAVVESVNNDGTITVTESSYVENSASPWNFLWRHRTVSPTWFQNFIHVSGGLPSLNPRTTIVNAASSVSGDLAAGELVSLYSELIAGTSTSAGAPPLGTALGGFQVSVNNLLAPILYVGPGQVNFQVPFGLSPGPASLAVKASDNAILSEPVNIVAAAPGIFTANGRSVIQNEDYSLNLTSNGALAGTYVVIYFTGQGTVDLPVQSGDPSPVQPLARTVAATTVTIGGRPAYVAFSGLTPGFAGLAQVNAQVPDNLPPGDYPISITVAGRVSNDGTITIK